MVRADAICRDGIGWLLPGIPKKGGTTQCKLRRKTVLGMVMSHEYLVLKGLVCKMRRDPSAARIRHDGLKPCDTICGSWDKATSPRNMDLLSGIPSSSLSGEEWGGYSQMHLGREGGQKCGRHVQIVLQDLSLGVAVGSSTQPGAERYAF